MHYGESIKFFTGELPMPVLSLRIMVIIFNFLRAVVTTYILWTTLGKKAWYNLHNILCKNCL